MKIVQPIVEATFCICHTPIRAVPKLTSVLAPTAMPTSGAAGANGGNSMAVEIATAAPVATESKAIRFWSRPRTGAINRILHSVHFPVWVPLAVRPRVAKFGKPSFFPEGLKHVGCQLCE